VALASKGRAVAWRYVDIIGDVHGCIDELRALLTRLGYEAGVDAAWRHPEGRKLVFVGDLCNRGPDTPAVLDLVGATVRAGSAITVLGNHDRHVLRWMRGKIDPRDDDLGATAELYARLPTREREDALRRHRRLLKQAPLWLLLDPADDGPTRPPARTARLSGNDPRSAGEGRGKKEKPDKDLRAARASARQARLVVAHAAWHPDVIGAAKKRARAWCLYGPTLPRDPETGRKPRLDWTLAYPADAPPCLHGHTAFDGAPLWRGRSLCIDTGCAYGGALSALRWPARRIVREPARRTYFQHLDFRPRPSLIDPRAAGLDDSMIARAEGAELR
jgi:protein phosphatase